MLKFGEAEVGILEKLVTAITDHILAEYSHRRFEVNQEVCDTSNSLRAVSLTRSRASLARRPLFLNRLLQVGSLFAPFLHVLVVVVDGTECLKIPDLVGSGKMDLNLNPLNPDQPGLTGECTSELVYGSAWAEMIQFNQVSDRKHPRILSASEREGGDPVVSH